MKFLITLTALVMSAIVYACPNLAGTYQCYDEELGYYDTTITQTGSGAGTVYTTETDGEVDVVHANNQWTTVTQNGVDYKVKAFCSGAVLNYVMNGNDPSYGQINIEMNISLDANRNMVTEGTITMQGQSFPAESSTCTRM